jgi:hypothetical protein
MNRLFNKTGARNGSEMQYQKVNKEHCVKKEQVEINLAFPI